MTTIKTCQWCGEVKEPKGSVFVCAHCDAPCETPRCKRCLRLGQAK